jgi:hypothetical protein
VLLKLQTVNYIKSVEYGSVPKVTSEEAFPNHFPGKLTCFDKNIY